MKAKSFTIGNTPFNGHDEIASGEYVTIENEKFYKISNYDNMQPFFMSIVSDSDHWMFISSNGALTAGRKNPDNALFPYYTDDRIHDSHDLTGSKTILFVTKKEMNYLWEPLSNRYAGLYQIKRNIYKNISGNKLIFEEINLDLALVFQYAWKSSEKFGFVKQSCIYNNGSESVTINLLDGIQNILPYGIDRRFQLEYSTLADGYKKNELLAETGLGLFSLSSIPTDKAEPSEALRATTVWSTGLENSIKLISNRQLEPFRKGFPVAQETDCRAARGAYFVNSEITLSAGSDTKWYIVAEINQDSVDVSNLNHLLLNEQNLVNLLESDINRGTENLMKIVANADGLQLTDKQLYTSRHFSNVLFNVMRGGIFDDNYFIERDDFILFVEHANKNVFNVHYEFLNKLPETFYYIELFSKIEQFSDPDFEKLYYEYLPLTFSRRHGDPSRPWNMFSIDIKDNNGEKILNYQGNWRDIFQNWEALALSFPGFIESMICKFVNASTADGYNPYRVTRDGFDWEVLDPTDAWSYIGYWGDHQVIYLLKLLALSKRYYPGKLQTLLTKEIFAYANVPYRIKPYQKIVQDPHNTIDFDAELDQKIRDKVEVIGKDGKFIWSNDENIYHVNLTEKLLVMLLAKLSNFIPEAGIWMNTQRPEWNDANNALVGYGVSMVTLYYLRRFFSFVIDMFESVELSEISLSTEVADMLDALFTIFSDHQEILLRKFSDTDRKKITDKLGLAGSDYRAKIYSNGFYEDKKNISISALINFFKLSQRYIDHSIEANKRDDNLFHAYNLIKFDDDKITIRYLYEMLEGQVAVLSSGYLSSAKVIDVLDALRNSRLYREDQFSYILYPNRQLARFSEKNNIQPQMFEQSELLKKLVEDGNKFIVNVDVNGMVHFNSDLSNGRILRDRLSQLKNSDYSELVIKDEQRVLEIYESVFDHQSFTGRSGTFYKYEGLGSIYWHMISKLLLAVQENYYTALHNNEDNLILQKLTDHYYEIRAGIGVEKSPEIYGAFPTDPYSHSPGHSGVQQPGMTGQVKEDIISRFGELGIYVENGCIHFNTQLLKKEEFLTAPASFHYYDVNGSSEKIELNANMLAFTFCQVPVLYCQSNSSQIVLILNDTSEIIFNETIIDSNYSRYIFDRRDIVRKIHVFVNM